MVIFQSYIECQHLDETWTPLKKRRRYEDQADNLVIRSINAREDTSGATKDERSRSLIQGQLQVTSGQLQVLEENSVSIK